MEIINTTIGEFYPWYMLGEIQVVLNFYLSLQEKHSTPDRNHLFWQSCEGVEVIDMIEGGDKITDFNY